MQKETNSTPTQTDPQTQARPHHHHNGTLFHHQPRPHQPRNVNVLHEAEKAAAGVNTQIAVMLTKSVGSMWTAYTFAVLAVIGLLAILGVLTPIVALLVAWASQTLIQLVLLPVIMVGQNVLSHKQELQADEQFRTTISTYHDIEQIMQHLSAQDAELLRHAKMLVHLLEKNGISPQELEVEGVTTSHLTTPSSPQEATAETPALVTHTQEEKPSI